MKGGADALKGGVLGPPGGGGPLAGGVAMPPGGGGALKGGALAKMSETIWAANIGSEAIWGAILAPGLANIRQPVPSASMGTVGEAAGLLAGPRSSTGPGDTAGNAEAFGGGALAGPKSWTGPRDTAGNAETFGGGGGNTPGNLGSPGGGAGNAPGNAPGLGE